MGEEEKLSLCLLLLLSVGVLRRCLALPSLVLRPLSQQLPPGLHGLPRVQGHPVGLCEEPELSPARWVLALVGLHEGQEVLVLGGRKLGTSTHC